MTDKQIELLPCPFCLNEYFRKSANQIVINALLDSIKQKDEALRQAMTALSNDDFEGGLLYYMSNKKRRMEYYVEIKPIKSTIEKAIKLSPSTYEVKDD